jgi:branched-chain amino acid transport system permease protein
VPAADGRARVWVALVATTIAVALLARVMRGRLGLHMRAVRDDEAAAALAGIPVARTRVLAFVVSAGAAGLAGGLYVWLTGTALPGYFGLTLSLHLLLAVVVGGVGSLAGAAWGTLFVVAVPIATASAVSALDVAPATAARLAGNLPLALFGLALILVTVAAPGGVGGVLRARREPPGHRGGPAAYENGRRNPTEGRSRTP